ncbi:recombinase family protein [Alkalihalophilus pseudofirmus]|uniref:recombinase family protein n=1 Tax=Alkalihalophilus pseudofirmus TaxID=79885 RepID=UPI0009511063|nr:recombinase family protein [Alkalihalophilus pseudofirmus]
MNKVCMYLRKSRADLEAEARGDGETLTKHKKALLKVAKSLELNIVKIRQEIVSGESLMHRPEMLELLKEVEDRTFDAVLVMDMDRLGRGNMREQGLILETFQKAKVKIITPRKTYDLSDEWDEEYSEFEAFMARKELKIITRRLQGGRIRSIEEGNYIATKPPYGYNILNLDNGRTLEPHPEQADVVKLIFDLYTNQKLGGSKVALELNKLGYKTYTGRDWSASAVLNIIKNEVYTGKVIWKKKDIKKSEEVGKSKNTRTRPKSDWLIAKGKHEPLISEELYEAANSILKGKYHVPYQLGSGTTNPLAGIIVCKKCGMRMVRRPYTKQTEHLICHNRNCDCKSTRLSTVENKLIQALKDWLHSYIAQWDEQPSTSPDEGNLIEAKEQAQVNLKKKLNILHEQKNKLHDFLERGIYKEETFLERSELLAEQIKNTNKLIEISKKELAQATERSIAQAQIIPKLTHILEIYFTLNDAEKKNRLLKSVLDRVEYKKEKNQKLDDFDLVLYPRLPN